MKRQYFGDIRDLFKFDVIENLIKNLELASFLYVIMLTKDGGTGGKKRDFDQAIRNKRFGTKNTKLLNLTKRVSSQKSEHRDISGEITKYYKETTPRCTIKCIDNMLEKDMLGDYFCSVYFNYFEQIEREMKGLDSPYLIFLDPDTGLEPQSSKGKEYVSFETVARLYSHLNQNSLMMIYQHGVAERTHKCKILNKISSYYSYISDDEIDFLFLMKREEVKKRIEAVLNSYKQNYKKVFRTVSR